MNSPKNTDSHRLSIVLLAVLSLGLLQVGFVEMGFVQTAHAEDPWHLRANFLAIDDGTYEGNFDFGDLQVATSIGHDNNLGLSLERRFNHRLGLQLSALSIKPDFGLVIADTTTGQVRGGSDTLDIFALTLGLPLHLTPGRRVDLYVEPLVGMMNVEDLSFTDAGSTLTLTTSDEVIFGLALGLDVPIRKSAWSFNANIRYLDLGFEATAEDGTRLDIEFEPIVAGLGIGYRF
jgi:outer membrane protein W